MISWKEFYYRFIYVLSTSGDDEESAPQVDDIMEHLRSRITHQKTWLDATKALRLSNAVSFVVKRFC